MKIMISKKEIYDIIFESQTKLGKLFDVVLLWVIGLSIVVAMLDSVQEISPTLRSILSIAEWCFTILFTLEYLMRIYASPNPKKYIFSFWGIVDIVAILPTYLSLFHYGYQYLLIVRILRMLRVFRVFRLVRFSRAGNMLLRALKASAYKIGVFFFTVICIVTILGTMMYVIEGPENGFTNIFQSIYWAIITITTVGYGDVVPHTVLGKILSSFIMIIGYSIIAVPTGIVTVELSRVTTSKSKCPNCGFRNIESANYCNNCGVSLKKEEK